MKMGFLRCKKNFTYVHQVLCILNIEPYIYRVCKLIYSRLNNVNIRRIYSRKYPVTNNIIHCTAGIKYIKAMVMLGLSNDNSAIPIKGGNLSYCLSCTYVSTCSNRSTQNPSNL